jgi:hypothetical protein
MGITMTCCSSTSEEKIVDNDNKTTSEHIPNPVVLSYPAIQDYKYMPRSISSTTILPT